MGPATGRNVRASGSMYCSTITSNNRNTTRSTAVRHNLSHCAVSIGGSRISRGGLLLRRARRGSRLDIWSADIRVSKGRPVRKRAVCRWIPDQAGAGLQRCIAQCRRAAAGSLLRRGLVRLHRRIPDSRLPSGGRGIDHPHWHDASRNSPIKNSTPADGDRGRPSGVSYLP